MKEKLFRYLVRLPFINKLFISVFYNKFLLKDVWGGSVFIHDIPKFSKLYVESFEQWSESKRKKLGVDIISSYYLYGVNVQEYFCFGFMNYAHKRRKTFLANQHKDKRVLDILTKEEWELLEDKAKFYERCKDFFHRDALLVTKENFLDFEEFCHKHKKFIAKPNFGQCGHGVRFIMINEDSDINRVYHNLIEEVFFVEELIVQTQAMADWNVSSVNTVRIPSFYIGGKIEILKPFIRFGRKGAIVDNANAGGVFAIIDEKSGVIKTDGYCLANGKFCSSHPDSNLLIKGWQIPQWNILLDTAKRVHDKIPDIPYIGFDFALTQNGWVLIEGNPGEFISEFCDREGIKSKFNNLLDRSLEKV